MNQCFIVPTIHLTHLFNHFHRTFHLGHFLKCLFPQVISPNISIASLMCRIHSLMRICRIHSFQIFSSIIASSANNSFISDQLAQLISTHMPSIKPMPNIGDPMLSYSDRNPIISPQRPLPPYIPPDHPLNSIDPIYPTTQMNQLSLPLAPIKCPLSNLKLSPIRKFALLKLLKIARRRVYLIKELNESWIEQNEKAEKRKEKDELLQRIRQHQSEFGRMDRDEKRIKRFLGPVRISQLKKLLDQYIIENEAKVRNLDQVGWIVKY